MARIGGDDARQTRSGAGTGTGDGMSWVDLAPWPVQPMPWCGLIGASSERNVFHEPEFLTQAVPFLAPDARLLVGVTASGDWAGALPLRAGRAGFVVPAICSFSHQYGPLGTPHMAGDVAEAWRRVLDRLQAEGASVLMLPHMRAEGAVFEGLMAATAASGRPVDVLTAWRRPVLLAGGAVPVCKVSMKRWRRLNREHDVRHEVIVDPALLMVALEQFLALELAGWKGRAGTALACHADSLAFVRGVVGLYGARGGIFIDRLSVDGRAVAMHIGLASGGEASMWKIAYDEALAAFSVGRQLLWLISRRLHGAGQYSRVDSLAMEEGGALADIWPDRLAMADLLVGCRPGGGVGFGLAGLDARLYRGARALAKRVRDRIKG